jgi:hypothetical protein
MLGLQTEVVPRPCHSSDEATRNGPGQAGARVGWRHARGRVHALGGACAGARPEAHRRRGRTPGPRQAGASAGRGSAGKARRVKQGPNGEGCHVQGLSGRGRRGEGEGEGGELTTTDAMNDGNRSSPVIQARVGREWERRKRERGGFSFPRSWVRMRGRGGRLGAHGGGGGWAALCQGWGLGRAGVASPLL